MTVRVAPLEQWPPGLRRSAEATVGGELRQTANVYRTLANHPELMLAWLALGGHLLRASTLDPRVRELAILRSTALSGGTYPHTQHRRIGREAGLSAADLERLIEHTLDDDPSAHWTGVDLAILTAVDRLHGLGVLDDHAWHPIRSALSVEQVLDLLATVAFYRMASWLLNACGTPPDDGAPASPYPTPTPTRPAGTEDTGPVRITPVPVEEWPPTLREETADWPRFRARPLARHAGVYGTLANHPRLFSALGPLMAHLLVDISLTEPRRELVIVRACLHDRGAYPYRQHVGIATAAGVDPRTLTALDQPAPLLEDPAEHALVCLVDDLHRTNGLTDDTWARVHTHLGTRPMMDAVVTTGFYGLISFILNTARTRLEPGDVRLPARFR